MVIIGHYKLVLRARSYEAEPPADALFCHNLSHNIIFLNQNFFFLHNPSHLVTKFIILYTGTTVMFEFELKRFSPAHTLFSIILFKSVFALYGSGPRIKSVYCQQI